MEQRQGIFWSGNPDNYFLGHQFEEIFKARIYAPYLENRTDAIVIDAGANIGLFSYYASRYASKVYSIEPSQEHQEILNYMIEYNGLKNIETFKFALSIKDGKEKLAHYNNKTMHSLYGAIASGEGAIGLIKTGEEETELKRIDTFFKEQKIHHVDLLKLDVEGVEFEILCGEAFANVADKIDTLVCEVHQYSGRHPQQIVDALEQLDYRVQKIPNDAFIILAQKPSLQTAGVKV